MLIKRCGFDIQPYIFNFNNSDDSGDDENDLQDIPKDICPKCKKYVKKYRMSDLSFNNPNGACPKCHGIGLVHTVNREVTIDKNLSIYEGALKSWGKNEIKMYIPIISSAAIYYGFEFDPNTKIKNMALETKAFVYYGNDDEKFKIYFPHIELPWKKNLIFIGFINDMELRYEKLLDNPDWTDRFGKDGEGGM